VAQCWLAGFSWRELVETTSLDQGDVCRHIRKARTHARVFVHVPRSIGRDRLMLIMPCVNTHITTTTQVIDALRQIPVLPRGLVPERLKNTARDAADRMCVVLLACVLGVWGGSLRVG